MAKAVRCVFSGVGKEADGQAGHGLGKGVRDDVRVVCRHQTSFACGSSGFLDESRLLREAAKVGAQCAWMPDGVEARI
jgi:hypothetical protein